MTANERLGCKLLAFLLEYPDAAWREELADASALAGTIQNQDDLKILADFLAYAAAASDVEIEEAYTSAFDLTPETTLNLTYHLTGDSKERGQNLAELLQLYRDGGFSLSGGELPDFLPLILEFLAIAPQPPRSTLLRSCLGAVSVVAQRLKERCHPYGGLLALAGHLVAPLAAQHSHTVNEEG